MNVGIPTNHVAGIIALNQNIRTGSPEPDPNDGFLNIDSARKYRTSGIAGHTKKPRIRRDIGGNGTRDFTGTVSAPYPAYATGTRFTQSVASWYAQPMRSAIASS